MSKRYLKNGGENVETDHAQKADDTYPDILGGTQSILLPGTFWTKIPAWYNQRYK